MSKYRKKPVVIDAIQFTGSNRKECIDFIGKESTHNFILKASYEKYTAIVIPTLEGDMRCDIGDYIIKGIKGEFYPCKPDIFEASYEKVTDVSLLTAHCIICNVSATPYNKLYLDDNLKHRCLGCLKK